MDKNIERAINIISKWPKWMRDFPLTKYSQSVINKRNQKEFGSGN